MQAPADFIEFRLSWAKVDLQLLGVLSSAVRKINKNMIKEMFTLIEVLHSLNSKLSQFSSKSIQTTGKSWKIFALNWSLVVGFIVT